MSSGGKRPGAGRPRGSKSKTTVEVRALAQQYGAQAVEALVKVMTEGESEAARIAAAKEILDRAYGRTSPAVDVSAVDSMPGLIDPNPDV